MQIIPLDNSPNQSLTVTMTVNGTNITLGFFLSYNEVSNYWVMRISDPKTGTVILDSIPLVTDGTPGVNILSQYEYMKIGAAYLIKQAPSDADYPDDTNLGTVFQLAWGDNLTYYSAGSVEEALAQIEALTAGGGRASVIQLQGSQGPPGIAGPQGPMDTVGVAIALAAQAAAEAAAAEAEASVESIGDAVEMSQKWATNPEDVPVVSSPDQFSSMHWALKAEATAEGISVDLFMKKLIALFDAATELTISSGSVTPTRTLHTIDTEASAASDDLTNITAGTSGQLLVFRAEHTDRTVVVKSTGNILTGGADITLDSTSKFLFFIYDSVLAKWTVVGGTSGVNSAALDGLTGAADRLPYFTGLGTMSITNFTSQARSLLDDTSFSAMRTTLSALGSVAGTLNALTEKTTPVDNDILLMEDSADSYNMKKVKKSSLAPTVPTNASSVRQTVLSASLSALSVPNFITAGAGLSVNIAATTTPIRISFANGFDADGASEKIGSVTSDTSISSLTASQTNYLYAERNTSTGAITLGKTTSQPQYAMTPSYKSVYPTAHSDTYVKATTKWDTSYWAYYATDPAKSLTGGGTSNSWNSQSGVNTNQRFHIDLGSAKVVTRIYYENGHESGGSTTGGVRAFTLQGSNTAGSFADLTYATDTGWTNLTTSASEFDQHVNNDVKDPKYITVTNTTAYRYYALKFATAWGGSSMAVRRIELQTYEDYFFVIPEMKMYDNTSGSAVAKQIVFLGEAVTDGSNVTSVVNYALRGEYQSPEQALTVTTTYTFNHNTGYTNQNLHVFGWLRDAANNFVIPAYVDADAYDIAYGIFYGITNNSTRNSVWYRTADTYLMNYKDSAGTTRAVNSVNGAFLTMNVKRRW